MSVFVGWALPTCLSEGLEPCPSKLGDEDLGLPLESEHQTLGKSPDCNAHAAEPKSHLNSAENASQDNSGYNYACGWPSLASPQGHPTNILTRMRLGIDKFNKRYKALIGRLGE